MIWIMKNIYWIRRNFRKKSYVIRFSRIDISSSSIFEVGDLSDNRFIMTIIISWANYIWRIADLLTSELFISPIWFTYLAIHQYLSELKSWFSISSYRFEDIVSDTDTSIVEHFWNISIKYSANTLIHYRKFYYRASCLNILLKTTIIYRAFGSASDNYCASVLAYRSDLQCTELTYTASELR